MTTEPMQTNLDYTLATILGDWNFPGFRPLQRESISAWLLRRDQLCIMPTGGGKSFCFQAPALRANGLTVVVTPLLSLMKDQVDRINRDRPRATHLPRSHPLAAAINSETHPVDEQSAITLAEHRQLPLLYVSPERFVRPDFFTWLSSKVRIATIVVDEAHCVTEWGASHGADGQPPFRKAYKELGQYIAALRSTQPQLVVSAFTATATPAVQVEIASALGLRDPAVFVGDFDRPNLTYRVVDRVDLDKQLLEFLAQSPFAATPTYFRPTDERRSRPLSGIIYAITRAETERIAALLASHGFRADFYHGEPSPANAARRVRVQEEFMCGDLDVIVATIAFGMGIDKPDVRFVLHAGMPSSLEVYHQEVGRAGRDGKPAECVLFYDEEDYKAWEQILTHGIGFSDPDPREDRLHRMNTWCQTDTLGEPPGVCRRHQLLDYFGQEHPGNCGKCGVCLAPMEARK